MTANILNISQYNSGVMVSYSITDDNGNLIFFDNTEFNGTPCINTLFPIPLTDTSTDDLEQNINSAIQQRLNTEFTKNSTVSIGNSIIVQVNKDLVGTTLSTTSLSVGSIVLTPTGSIPVNQGIV